MGNYIDIDQIDNWSSGWTDDEKNEKVNEIEQLVEKILGTHFYQKTFDIEINGNNRNRIQIPLEANITQVSNVYILGSEFDPSWYKFDKSSIMLDLDSSVNELKDGGFEDWASTVSLEYWTKSISGTSTVNRDSTNYSSGSYSCRFDVDALNSDVYIYQDFEMQAYREYTLNITRMMSAVGVTARFMIRDKNSNVWLQGDGTWGDSATWITLANVVALTAYSLTFKANASYREYRIYLDRLAGTSKSIYFDDAEIKKAVGGTITDPELMYRLSSTAARGLFPHGFNNIRVVGKYGYLTVPLPIKQLCIILVRYDNDPSLYTSSKYTKEKIGDYSYEYGGTGIKSISIVTGIFEADRIIAIYKKQKKIKMLAP